MAGNPSWYKRRPFLHFDLPLGSRKAASYVSNPANIIHHSFYPFLTYDLLTSRFRKPPKCRRISYPAHKDGYIFSFYKSKLEIIYEEWLKKHGLEEAVTAFRSTTGENNVSLAKKAFEFIRANPGCQIVATDIESFFDTIAHKKLKEVWERFLGKNKLPDDHYAVYKAITGYSVVQKHKIYNLFKIRLAGRINKTTGPERLCTPDQFRQKVIPRGLVQRNPGMGLRIGIPQGSSLSPLLSNMYMCTLDLAMNDWVVSHGGKYWRYCDDILIVVPNGKHIPILARLDNELTSLELSRSHEKTQVTADNLLSHQQLQYLGFLFNGRDTSIRSSSIHRYHRKLKNAIRASEYRRNRETKNSLKRAPLRQQALYNMYSELPLRGKKIRERKTQRIYPRNFTFYMKNAGSEMNSPNIQRQRRKALKQFRSSVRDSTSKS